MIGTSIDNIKAEKKFKDDFGFSDSALGVLAARIVAEYNDQGEDLGLSSLDIDTAEDFRSLEILVWNSIS